MHNAYRLVQTVLGPCPHIAPTVYAAGFMRTFLQTFSAADFYTCSRQAPYSAGLSRPDVTPEPARYNINLCQRFVTPDVLPTYADEQTRPFIPSGRHGFLSAPTAASRTAVPNLTPSPHTVSIMPCPRGFRSPVRVCAKNFYSIIGSFLSFRHNVQLLLPGLNVYPSRFSENISRIPRPSVLSATEMPKHLRPVSAL